MGNQFPAVRSEAEMASLLVEINSVSIHGFLGLEVIEAKEGVAISRFTAVSDLQTPYGTVHAGSYYVALDTAAAAASATVLPSNKSAVTHDIFVSVLRSAPVETEIMITSRVIKTGKALVFLESEAKCEGKIVATARITKSIIEQIKSGS
ncbi:MAG: PaaI family thioesterase [Rhodospirillales bacterium]|nr:PaaI family thioesterase [Rhodospirillales bacterium]